MNSYQLTAETAASALGVGRRVPPPAERLAWIDNLRTAMIVAVVNMHACVTYSHVGSWYVMEGTTPAPPLRMAFLLWQCCLQAFFMGLLFFLAGFFAFRSIERRGPGAFLRERCRRLGVPSLIYVLIIHPWIIFVLLRNPQRVDPPPLVDSYSHYIASGRFLSGTGPMWFAVALLLFSSALAGLWVLRPFRRGAAETPARAPGTAELVCLGAGLGLGTFLVRIVQPLGTNAFNFQLCFFPQYIAAFAAGVLAGRRGWLEALAASNPARVAGGLGLLGGPLIFILILALGGPPPADGPTPYAGGWNFRALALAGWEQSAGLAIALGVLSWFHHHGRQAGPIANWLADRSFAVYFLHAPVLVTLTPLLRPVATHPLVGVTLLTLAGLAVSLLAADLARRMPGLRQIL